jgi:hypothetical protein
MIIVLALKRYNSQEVTLGRPDGGRSKHDLRPARLISEGLTPTNLVGNAVATIVVASWERALDETRLQRALAGEIVPALA